MKIVFDIAKNILNIQKHGIPLTAALGFRMDSAILIEDDRYDYGEARWQAYGFVGRRQDVLVFTMRGQIVRVISLRKANPKERKKHGFRA